MLTTMVGYGLSGFYNVNGKWYTAPGSYGTRRKGDAVIGTVGQQVMELPFDGGQYPLYSIVAPGDSGGGIFATFADTITLVGVPTGNSNYPFGSGDHSIAARVSTAQLWILGFSTGFTLCHAYSVTQGYASFINPQNVYYSDSDRASVESRPPVSLGGPSVQIEFIGYAPHLKDDVANLTFIIQSRTDAIPVAHLEQRIELWDWEANAGAGAWVWVSTTTPSATDTTVTVEAPGTNDKRFVKPLTEEVKARVGWYEIDATANTWKVEINQATWTITRN